MVGCRRATCLIAMAGVGTILSATSTAFAVTYHVAAGTCSHGSGVGSDSSDGLGRSTALLTVQKCLDKMRAGDTCQIHTGTYTGDFECCGNGTTTPTPMNGTASAPTRILGAPGDVATLNGTSSQTVPNKDASPRTDQNTANVGTITFWNSGGNGADYFEVGGLTINPGRGATIVASGGSHGYLHDITVTSLSSYTGLTTSVGGVTHQSENSGIFFLFNTTDVFVSNLTLGNGGTIVPANIFMIGAGDRFHARNLNLADFRGALERQRGFTGVWEFVKVRNYQPWTGDDGTLIGLYNAGPMQMRYIDVKETSNTYTLQGYRWAAGHRNFDCSFPIGISLFSNWTYEDANKVDENWSVLGVDDPGPGCGQENYTGAWNNAFINAYKGLQVWKNTSPSSTSDCSMFTFSHNAYQNVTTPVTGGLSACSYSGTETGRVSGTLNVSSEHVPNAGALVINTGRSDVVGDAKVFPPPVGGGSTVDIGAWESGAGAWPYEFQVSKTVAKNPVTQTIRLCWASGVPGCDFTFYWWDPYSNNSAARSGPPGKFILELDQNGGFHSGRTGVAAGFGPLFTTGVQNSSNRFYDVPLGTLAPNQTYYVRVITAINDSWSAGDNGGWGTWSQGFYRFQLGTGSGDPTPPANVNNVRRTDQN